MTNLIKSSKAKEIILFSLGCLSILTVILTDKLMWGDLFFKDSWPDFSMHAILRSVIIFAGLLTIFWSIIKKRNIALNLYIGTRRSLKMCSMVSMLLLALIILVLFLVDPPLFNALSKEDGIVEWASASALFAGFIISLIALLDHTHHLPKPRAIRFTLLIMALGFFVLGMEEISWFQRVIDIETPELFEGNQQQEMNLHNFATDYLENIYYFGTFVFLVLLPFLRVIFKAKLTNPYFKLFIPRPYIAILGIIACAYNFDMWNILFSQITFFTSFIVLITYAYFSKNLLDLILILLSLALLLFSQIIFLSNGQYFDRLWEITEYKELLIAIPLFIYTWDVALQLRRQSHLT